VLQVLMVLLVLPVLQVLLALLADPLAQPDLLAPLDLPDQLVRRVLQALVLLEQQALRAQLVQQE
jgi:hypothetical protein